MLLVNLPKHCKISCEILFLLQCDLLNPSPTNVADNTNTKSWKPQLTREQKKHSTFRTPCCPLTTPKHKPLAFSPPFPSSHSLPTPDKTKQYRDYLETSHLLLNNLQLCEAVTSPP